MKKIILLTLILGSSLVMNAQIDSKPRLSEVKAQGKMVSAVKLCQLKAYHSEDGKVKIMVDFGDITTLNKAQNDEIAKGKYDRKFDNVVDALRFMSTQGWQLEETYDTKDGDSTVTNFILRRR